MPKFQKSNMIFGADIHENLSELWRDLKFTKIGPLEMGKDRVTDTRAYLNNVELGASQNVDIWR